MNIKNKPTVIKLYFKKEELNYNSASMIVTLLSLAFEGTDEYKNYDFAVLDIRRSKLVRLTEKIKKELITETLKIEAHSWLLYQESIK